MIKYVNDCAWSERIMRYLVEKAPRNVSASIQPYYLRERENGVNVSGYCIWLYNQYQIYVFQATAPYMSIVVCKHEREPFTHNTCVIEQCELSIGEWQYNEKHQCTGAVITDELIAACGDEIIKLIKRYKKAE